MDEPTRFLVQRAQCDDRDAMAQLIARYRERVRGALRRMLGDEVMRRHMDSEDAVQDAILVAMNKIDRFEHRGEGSFLAWLLQSARNELLMRQRAARAQKRGAPVALDSSVDPPSPEPSPSQVARGRELEEQVADALQRLPAAEREVIVLRRYFDAGFDEIAGELELPSAGAARALLSRAQVRLAQELGDAGDG